MSDVTNVILTFSILENAELRLRNVNQYFSSRWANETHTEDLFEVHDTAVAGTKFLEHPTCIGAFNYLNADAFLKHVVNVPWEYPDKVQVFICDQDEDSYTDRFPDYYLNFHKK